MLYINVYIVGYDYEKGTGVAKDQNKAREWYIKSAAQGEKDAQIRLDKLNAQ